jgi:4,5-DOPA dioxygenase extradiol
MYSAAVCVGGCGGHPHDSHRLAITPQCPHSLAAVGAPAGPYRTYLPMTASTNARMPTIFFGHGSPMNTLEHNRYTETWRQLGALAGRPKAILAISAHWYTQGTAVTAMEQPKTIHDFYGFPEALFNVQYPAPGDPDLAARVRDLLAPTAVAMDHSWGLDHGTWSVLKHAFPGADIPVVQLAIDATQPAAFHHAMGAHLAPLRDEGVLIVGSGNVVHNLRLIGWGGGAPYDWATRFNDYVRDALATRQHQQLVDYAQAGQDARLAVPTPEHYLPMLYVLGAQHPDESLHVAIDGIEIRSIGMLSFWVGSR